MTTSIKSILLADDDSDDVYFFQYILNEICPDCKLTVASNGEQLVNTIKNSDSMPDLVFIDINMPIMNGLEAIEKIKELPLPPIPLIVYSTSTNERDIVTAFEKGANSYIVKPSDMDTLALLVSKILADWENLNKPQQIEKFVLQAK